MTMRIQYIAHDDCLPPGALMDWAERHGFSSQICKPFRGEPLPSADDFDWLIVLGGPQRPHYFDKYPYLKDEIALIAEAKEQGKPLLGFCLGAQLIGEAHGARTGHSPNQEIGVFPIELSEAGRQDPLLEGLPERFPVPHWHVDMPGLNDDCEILASSEGCPRQIVRYGPLAYGFQCHPEFTREELEGIFEVLSEDLAQGGPYVQDRETYLSADFDSIHKNFFVILERFLKLIETSTVCKKI